MLVTQLLTKIFCPLLMVASQISLPPAISSFCPTSTTVLQNKSHRGPIMVRSLDGKTRGTHSPTKVLTFRQIGKLRTCAGVACLNNMFYEVLVWHSPGLHWLHSVLKDYFLRNGCGQREMEYRSVCLQSVVCTPTQLWNNPWTSLGTSRWSNWFVYHCYNLKIIFPN